MLCDKHNLRAESAEPREQTRRHLPCVVCLARASLYFSRCNKPRTLHHHPVGLSMAARAVAAGPAIACSGCHRLHACFTSLAQEVTQQTVATSVPAALAALTRVPAALAALTRYKLWKRLVGGWGRVGVGRCGKPYARKLTYAGKASPVSWAPPATTELCVDASRKTLDEARSPCLTRRLKPLHSYPCPPLPQLSPLASRCSPPCPLPRDSSTFSQRLTPRVPALRGNSNSRALTGAAVEKHESREI